MSSPPPPLAGTRLGALARINKLTQLVHSIGAGEEAGKAPCEAHGKGQGQRGQGEEGRAGE